VAVQFNPQTLKVNYSNQKAGGDQSKGSSVQFVGKGTTKLTCELIFDVTVLEEGGENPPAVKDVRVLTARVSRFMKPRKVDSSGNGKKPKEPTYVPPAVRFAWGTFSFEGVMDSVDETLEFFSAAGVPLRATVSISISKQEIKVPPQAAPSPGGAPGTTPFAAASENQNLQALAGSNYKDVGMANGVENLRSLSPGMLIDLNATGIAASLGGGGGLEAPLSGGIDLGGSLGLGGGTLGGSLGLGEGLSGDGEISFR
jgi:hypothetical protein